MAIDQRREKEKTPKELVREKLEASGLDENDARLLGFTALRPDETAALNETFRPVPSLKIPYYTPSKNPTNFFRLRYLMPYVNGFDAFTIRKQPKYVQLPNSPTEVYWPRNVDWAALASGKEAITITEGELKAACASKNGFPTIGLGGVWSWRSAKKNQPIVPSLTPAGFNWLERPVYVCFDSDQITNPDVARAQLHLCAALTSLGAQPKIVSLPRIDDEGAKTGLDDFIVAQGADAYLDLLTSAPSYETSRELFKMNSEVSYIKDPGLIVVLGDGRRISAQAFTSHAYSNRHFFEQTVKADGTPKITKKSLPVAWLEWEQRSELERIVYEPGYDTITNDRCYNMWKGWGCRPKKGDISLWRDLLDYAFDGQPEDRKYFERWCAYPIQHPGFKMYTATVIWSVSQGTGKSLIGYSIGKIYGQNFTEIGEEQLHGSFNDWVEGKQFVMGDDVTSGERRQKLSTIDRLKNMITQDRMKIDKKFVPMFEVRDCVNYYFTSNHPDAFYLEDTDRRFFIHEIRNDPMERSFYKEYDGWLHDKNGCGPALFHHLLNLDIGDFDPRSPAPMTISKQLMITDNKSDLGAWVYKLKENPDLTLRLGGVQVPGDLFTNDQLLLIYDQTHQKSGVTANGLGRELKRAGFRYAHEGRVLKTCHGPQRLYIIRNREKWETAKANDLTKYYNSIHADTQPTEKKPKY